MLKIKRLLLGAIVLPMLLIGLSSGGGGSKNSGGGSSSECSNIQEKNFEVLLWKTMPKPYGRVKPAPSSPNPWTGATGATSPNQNRYYCEVNIESPECPSYSRSYTWNVGSDRKTIKVPKSLSFNITVI